MVIGETTYLSGKCILVDRKCCGKAVQYAETAGNGFSMPNYSGITW